MASSVHAAPPPPSSGFAVSALGVQAAASPPRANATNSCVLRFITGPERRQLAWRADGAGLTFLMREPAPEGEQEEDSRAKRGDRVMLWQAPFTEETLLTVYSSERRISDHRYSADHGMLWFTERPGGNGRGGGGGGAGQQAGTVRMYAVDLEDPERTFSLASYGTDDFYANPGELLNTCGRVPSGRGFNSTTRLRRTISAPWTRAALA